MYSERRLTAALAPRFVELTDREAWVMLQAINAAASAIHSTLPPLPSLGPVDDPAPPREYNPLAIAQSLSLLASLNRLGLDLETQQVYEGARIALLPDENGAVEQAIFYAATNADAAQYMPYPDQFKEFFPAIRHSLLQKLRG